MRKNIEISIFLKVNRSLLKESNWNQIASLQPNKWRRKRKDLNGTVTCTTNVVKLSRLWYSFNYLPLLKKQPNHTKLLPRFVIYYSVCIGYVANQFTQVMLEYQYPLFRVNICTSRHRYTKDTHRKTFKECVHSKSNLYNETFK